MSCGVFILALNAILNTQHIPQTIFSKSYFRRDRRLRSIDRWRRNTTFCLWIAIVTETPRAHRVSRFAGSISHSLKLSCIFMTKREAEGVCDVCSICCTSPPRSLDSNEQQFIFVHHLHETLVHAPICFQRFYLYTTHTLRKRPTSHFILFCCFLLLTPSICVHSSLTVVHIVLEQIQRHTHLILEPLPGISLTRDDIVPLLAARSLVVVVEGRFKIQKMRMTRKREEKKNLFHSWERIFRFVGTIPIPTYRYSTLS